MYACNLGRPWVRSRVSLRGPAPFLPRVPNPDRRRSAWCRQADGMLRGAALVSLTLFAVPTTAAPPPSPSPPPPVPFPPPLPPPSPSPPQPPGFKCTNTCGGNLQGPSRPRAGDGRCDDGGPGDTRFWPYNMGYSKPACPFGEDCDDCGPRALPPPPAAPPPPPPAPPPLPFGETCSNECGGKWGLKANNGVCDEEIVDYSGQGYMECGGDVCNPNREPGYRHPNCRSRGVSECQTYKCWWGSDCADCGPRRGKRPMSAGQATQLGIIIALPLVFLCIPLSICIFIWGRYKWNTMNGRQQQRPPGLREPPCPKPLAVPLVPLALPLPIPLPLPLPLAALTL